MAVGEGAYLLRRWLECELGSSHMLHDHSAVLPIGKTTDISQAPPSGEKHEGVKTDLAKLPNPNTLIP
jgi:hypothetical protein